MVRRPNPNKITGQYKKWLSGYAQEKQEEKENNEREEENKERARIRLAETSRKKREEIRGMDEKDPSKVAGILGVTDLSEEQMRDLKLRHQGQKVCCCPPPTSIA